MFRESYEKKLSGNYLLLEEEHEAENNEFEVRMLTENKIPGLLPCSVRLIDKKKQYAYDITSRQSLERLYETQDIGFLDMQILLRGIMSGIESVSEYFLEEGNLILRPAYIYMDIETKQAALCFFPFYQMDIRQSFQEFSEYLLQKTDHADERAVVLAYGFYKQVINEDYCFEKLFQRELPVSETIPVLEAEEKRPEAASSSNAGLQEKKLPGNEKTAFFISCSVLLLL
ncbi:MAG TPA: DUF6382 domain-containing protein, partial [Lachnospiraceae bacterium]|nr:DUF6382 domain-containing protein [Lachnospiraceae bacterium]